MCRILWSVFVITVMVLVCAGSAGAQGVAWMQQFGTSSNDWSYAVSSDGAGSVYTTGWTEGSLAGPNAGDKDAFISKYSTSGQLIWTRQFGSAGYDTGGGGGVYADGSGNVYLAGKAGGALPGATGSGGAFVSKYDAGGNHVWTTQAGTASYWGSGVTADGLGNVYTSGWNATTDEAFLSKYDAGGNLVWTAMPVGETSYGGIAPDGQGGVYASGYAGGNHVGISQAWVARYDANGNEVWYRSYGSAAGYGVSADGMGNVYVSGWTGGDLERPNAGGMDAYVRKYDADGNAVWTRQFGTSGDERSYGVAADGAGGVYVSGTTEGSLGPANAGGDDVFVRKYDANGNVVWTYQSGTSDDDRGFGVSADGSDGVFFTGYTEGDLAGPNAGQWDAFVGEVPEPASAAFLALGAGALLRRRQRR